jgi:hypothetical protein
MCTPQKHSEYVIMFMKFWNSYTTEEHFRIKSIRKGSDNGRIMFLDCPSSNISKNTFWKLDVSALR